MQLNISGDGMCHTDVSQTTYVTVTGSHNRHHTIQYNTIQYNTIQYNTIQYNTIQYNTIQYNTIQYNTIQLYCPGPGNSR